MQAPMGVDGYQPTDDSSQTWRCMMREIRVTIEVDDDSQVAVIVEEVKDKLETLRAEFAACGVQVRHSEKILPKRV